MTQTPYFVVIGKGTQPLTHWSQVTHICVSKLTIIGSDNGLSPGRCQASILTNAGILLIGPLGTNPHEILIEMQIFSLKKKHFKMSSAKWRSICLGFNVLTHRDLDNMTIILQIIFLKHSFKGCGKMWFQMRKLTQCLLFLKFWKKPLGKWKTSSWSQNICRLNDDFPQRFNISYVLSQNAYLFHSVIWGVIVPTKFTTHCWLYDPYLFSLLRA